MEPRVEPKGHETTSGFK